MTENPESQVSESQIAVHWREEEYYYPPESFKQQANAADPAIFDRFSEENFPDCFKEYSDLLSWDAPWDTILDTSNAPFWKWFVGGRLNASYNCVDRHLAASANKAAIIWVPEPESDEPGRHHLPGALSPGQRVRRAAARLRRREGRRPGDAAHADGPRAAGHRCLPARGWASSTPRCSAGSAATPAATRIADSGSRILITMDGYYRSGTLHRPQGQGR